MSNQSDDGVGWEGESISSSQSLILDLPPSCIEFCPAHPAYFLVGTYNLQKEEHQQTEDNDDDDDAVMKSKAKQLQSRNGSIIVFQLKEDGKVSVDFHRYKPISTSDQANNSHQISHPNPRSALSRLRSPFPTKRTSRGITWYMRNSLQHGHHLPLQAHANYQLSRNPDPTEHPQDPKSGRRYHPLHLFRMASRHRGPYGHHHRRGQCSPGANP